MAFLYPAFLFASFAIIIPVVIHLFNFRQHKIVYFSNITFLKNINEETKSKSQLKHLLIMFTRILFILALVIAFSQPFIPNENTNLKQVNNQIGIYLDNSFSMNSEGKFGNIFEQAKNKSFNILDAYSNNTQFVFLDNDLNQVNQRLHNKETVMDFVLNQSISANSRNLSEINSKFINLFSSDSASTKQIYFISDFQKTRADFENLDRDSSINYIFVHQTVQKNNNLYIDSVWFENPFRTYGSDEKIFANIVNSSDENYIDIPVNLYINDSLKTVSSLTINANSELEFALDYSNTKKGILNCKIELSDYPVTFDNVFYFNYEIKEKVNVLIINEKDENIYLKKLFEGDENTEVENFYSNSIKSSEFYKFSTIILCEVKEFSSGLISELKSYIGAGGNVLLIPAADGNIVSYNKFLSELNSNTFSVLDTADTRIETVNLNNVLYKEAFKEIDENSEFPLLSKYYRFNPLAFSSDITLLETENNTKTLSVNNYEKGLFYVLNIPLNEEFSNFQKHPIFVPTIYNIAMYSTSKNQLYYTLGIENIVTLENLKIEDAEVVHIVNQDNSYEFIPQIISSSNNVLKINMMNNIKDAGNYYLTEGDKKIAGLSFNFSREESEMQFYSDTEIDEMLKALNIKNYKILSSDEISIEQELKDLNEGVKLWKLFIILALIFLGIEIVLIKFWK